MHELSIALSIVEMAEEEAERRGVQVVAVCLKLGPLSGVVKEALLSSFEIAREGTPLENARLDIEDVPIVLLCPVCRVEREAASAQQMCCSVCGTFSADVIRGRELEVVALEICDAPDNAPGRSPAESAQAQ